MSTHERNKFNVKKHVTTIAELFPSLSLSFNHASIITSTQLCRVCILYPHCLWPNLLRKLCLKFISFGRFTLITCLQSPTFKVSWCLKWKPPVCKHGRVTLPKTLSLTLPHATSLFPNINVLLLVLLSLYICQSPLTSQRAVLVDLRTFQIHHGWGNEQLSSLTLLHLHNIQVEDVLDPYRLADIISWS